MRHYAAHRMLTCTVIVADRRVSDWPLVSSVWPTISLTVTYLIIIRVGPSLMNSRPQGFDFPWTLFCFNAALVALNLYIFIEVSSVHLTLASGHRLCRFQFHFSLTTRSVT